MNWWEKITKEPSEITLNIIYLLLIQTRQPYLSWKQQKRRQLPHIGTQRLILGSLQIRSPPATDYSNEPNPGSKNRVFNLRNI
ncbi:hypothetical protein TNCV_4864961 [Trichonephila clavipes]|nr:hypothetical protein TNCV_4864961 [Trichonephila clavipes]